MDNSQEQPDSHEHLRHGATDQRRGAIGVIVRADGRLLVIERSQTVRAPGRYCFPGGGIEAGESEEQAVERELIEELNIRVKPIRRLWESETRSGVLLHWWLVQPINEDLPAPNPDEVARCFWMLPAEITKEPKTLQSNREFLAAFAEGQFSLDP